MSNDVCENDAGGLLENPEIVSFSLDWLLGGIAAAFAKTVIAPVERVKLLLQTQNASTQFNQINRPHYSGIVDCLVRIPQEQGYMSFWRGNTTNVLRSFPTQAFNFAFNDKYKSLILAGIDERKDFKKYFLGGLLAGGLAGGSTQCFVYPLSVCQTRITTDIGNGKATREFRGLYDCCKKIVAKDGFLGLYHGFLVSVSGVIVYRSVYFGFYSALKVTFEDSKEDTTLVTKFLSAECASVLSGLLSYPMDTVSRRLMMQSGKQRACRIYHNTQHCYRTILEEEGLAAFYKGGLTNTMRATGGALVLVIYDEIKTNFNR